MEKRIGSLNSSAFTLVEVLIAITLIVILALLIVSIGKSTTEAAATTRCTSNLRQAGTLLRAYAGDHQGIICLHSYETDKPGTSMPWADYLANNGYMKRNSDIQLCQSTSPRHYTARGNIYGVFMPTAAELKNVPYDFLPPNYSSGTRFVRVGTMSDPAAYWLLTDSWSTAQNAQLYVISETYAGVHFRHQGRANFLFADGHVESLTPAAAHATRYYPTSKGYNKNGDPISF